MTLGGQALVGSAARGRGSPAAQAAAMIEALGPIADRLGSRGTIAQYEADAGDPARTRAGTSFANTTVPLPRFIPVRDIVRMSFNILELTPPATIMQRLARSVRIPSDDNLMIALPVAPTLGAALELSVRYGDATLPWWRRSLEVADDELLIVYRPAAPMGMLEAISAELTLVSTHRTVEAIMGPRVCRARINFAVPPISDVASLSAQLCCPVTVGGDSHYMAVPRSALDWPSPYHDDALWQEGRSRCENDLRLLQDVPLVGRVRAHVRNALDRGQVPCIETTATQLGLSKRSLVRALGANGMTHHELVDTQRRLRAKCLLVIPNLTLPDIAEQLGFSDQSSFGRKCREWFGETPARVRQQLLGQ